MGCKKRCRGKVVDKELGRYCSCLERKIPAMSKGRMPTLSPQLVDSKEWGEVEWGTGAGSALDRLETKLKLFGLKEHQIILLLARYVDKKTLKEIAKEQGWRSEDAAAYHVRNALKELRERGFK